MGILDRFFGARRAGGSQSNRQLKRSFRFEGGDGSSIESAVVICGVSGSLVGISAEYAYISQHCGREKVDWNLEEQAVIGPLDGRHYDEMKVTLRTGQTRVFYFDVSEFYGRF